MILTGETWLVNEYGEKMPVDVQNASLYMGEPLKITVIEKYPHTRVSNSITDYLREMSIARCPDITWMDMNRTLKEFADSWTASATTCTATLSLIQGRRNENRIGIKKVIFNDPATIVFWEDGTKTVVKCQEGDEYSKETGLALCIVKKISGNKGNYNNIFRKWVEE